MTGGRLGGGIALAFLVACRAPAPEESAASEAASPASEAADATSDAPLLAVRAAGMVDVRAGALVPDAVLLVRGRTIEAAGSADEVRVPPGARVIELPELVLLPGLIDAHVHLAWGPAQEGAPLPGAVEARAMLEAGFTSVRSLGSTAHADGALQRAIEAGELVGPRMQIALSGIGPAGGVCAQVFAGEATATTPEEGAARVRELAAAGAGVIKVCAGGGVLPSLDESAACECSAELLARVVLEARAAGLAVAAHAQGPAAVARAVEAGVTSIEHGGMLDGRSLELLVERGTYLVPTLARIDWLIEDARARGAPEPRVAALREARALAFESAASAVASGAKIALGTDAGVWPPALAARELGALVEVGLSPLEALRAGTIHAAELLGWSERVGALAPGLHADVIGVRGNPLADVGLLERVEFVLAEGAVIVAPKDDPEPTLPTARRE